MKKILKVFFFLILLFCIPKTVFAQDSNWVITDFSSNIHIQTNGKVAVNEFIKTNFFTAKHGIYRDIPFRYSNSDNSYHYTTVDVTEVTQDGQPAQYSLSHNDDYIRVKIGDPNRTIMGEHFYGIRYELVGVLSSYPKYDEFYWNVTGFDWDAPIEKVNAAVTLGTGTILNSVCFQGQAGSTESCSTHLIEERTAQFDATRPLSEGENVSIAINFPTGTVPILTVKEPQYSSYKPPHFGIESGIAYLITFFGGIGLIWWLWLRFGRDYWWKKSPLLGGKDTETIKPLGAAESIVVEYTPPEKLRPAEIGVIADERADTLDISATIIDLATQGYLTITEIEKTWLFGSTDYLLKNTHKDTGKLLEYEKLLLQKLFDGKNDVKISELEYTFYSDLAKVKKELYKDMVQKKIFPTDPDRVRSTYLAFGVVALIISIFLIFVGIFLPTGIILSIGAGSILPSILLMIFSRSMSRRTAYGRELYRRTKGYELFIGHVEKYRQQFFERKNMFNDVLPYAIVFGLTEKFAQAMKDIGVKPPQPTWYYGIHPFNPVAFGSNINSFSNSLSSAIASTPKSSGFSSGGGFSGGGFGGGGGGSW